MGSLVQDDTRSRVLAAAGPIFADKGFQSTTVREICAAAEVNLASVNYHFGDKEQLYVETVQQAHQERTREVPLPSRSEGTDAATRLRDFIHTMITRMVGRQEAPWQTRLMLREVLQPSKACEELVREYFRPQFGLLVAILRELVPQDAPEHRLHQIAFSIVGQCLYYRVAGQVVSLLIEDEELETHYSTDALADHISSFTLASLPGTQEKW